MKEFLHAPIPKDPIIWRGCSFTGSFFGDETVYGSCSVFLLKGVFMPFFSVRHMLILQRGEFSDADCIV